MSDLPDPQSYYIFLNISVSTRKPFGAIIKDGEEVLRAIWGQKKAVSRRTLRPLWMFTS
jgi:hypothetical protein